MFKPVKLIKFFKPSDRKYYRRGQIRFGTLEQYRSIENERLMGARFDPNDGVAALDYKMDGELAEDVRIPRLTMQNVRIEGEFGRVRKNFYYNEWAFCSSIGPYRKGLHDAILCGESNGYPGDSRLTHYAILDADKLERAIGRELKRQPGYQSKDGSPNFISGIIDYNKRAAIRSFSDPNFKDSGNPTVHDWNKALFSKDVFFRPEMEFRMIARVNCNSALPNKSDVLLLSSLAIKRSIDCLGVWKGGACSDGLSSHGPKMSK